MKNIWTLLFLLSVTVACNLKKEDNANGEALLNAAELVNNPKQADGTVSKDTSEYPIFHFEEATTFDFGTLQEGEKVQHKFIFTNTGKTPLLINNAQASCGCTASDFSKTAIAPGQKGWVKVIYDSYNRPGSFQKTVTVFANTYPNTLLLTVIGDVQSK